MSSRGHGEAGFTVLELMIGLAILAMMATAVTLAMPQVIGPPREAAIERAAGYIERLRADAVLSGKALVVRVSAGGLESDGREAIAFPAGEMDVQIIGSSSPGEGGTLLVRPDGSLSGALVLVSGGERRVIGWQPIEPGQTP